MIAATNLQGAVVLTLQLHEVISLQQHVGKFGVGNTVGFQATLDGVAIQHGVEGEVLAHIAQEINDRHVHGPVCVVNHGRRIFAVEVNELTQLLLNSFEVAVDLFLGEHGALAHITWIANKAGCTTCESQGLMPCFLEATQHNHGDQVASMQGITGGVKADVEGNWLFTRFAQRVDVGGLVD